MYITEITSEKNVGSYCIDDVKLYGRELTSKLDMEVDSNGDINEVISRVSYVDVGVY